MTSKLFADAILMLNGGSGVFLLEGTGVAPLSYWGGGTQLILSC